MRAESDFSVSLVNAGMNQGSNPSLADKLLFSPRQVIVQLFLPAFRSIDKRENRSLFDVEETLNIT